MAEKCDEPLTCKWCGAEIIDDQRARFDYACGTEWNRLAKTWERDADCCAKEIAQLRAAGQRLAEEFRQAVLHHEELADRIHEHTADAYCGQYCSAEERYHRQRAEVYTAALAHWHEVTKEPTDG